MPQAIGALPAVPSAAAGLPQMAQSQFFGAISQIPQAMQQQQLVQQTQQEQQAELAQKALERITQVALSSPQAAQQPQLRPLAERFAKLAGIPVPYDPAGNIDWQGLVPKRPMNDAETTTTATMTPEQRQAWASSHPEINVSPGWLNMQPTLTAADRTQGYITYRNLLDKVADPKSAGVDALRSFAGTPLGKALFPNLSDLANDPDFQTQMQNRVDATLNELAYKNIIHPEEMLQLRSRFLDVQAKHLQQTDADRARALADREHQYAVQESHWQQNFGLSQRRLQQSDARLDQALAMHSATAIQKYASDLKTAASSLQTGLDSVDTNIRGYVTSGEEPPPQLLARRDELAKQLENARSKADAAMSQVGGMLTHTVNTMSGATHSQVNTQQQVQTTVRNGKTYYLNPDGNWYTTPP